MSKLDPVIRRQGRCYTGMDITGDYFYIFKADNAAKARELIRFIQVDYSDNTPIAQFPPLRAVDRSELRQTAIREQSSFEARRLLSRKVQEKLHQSSAYEEAKNMAGTASERK